MTVSKIQRSCRGAAAAQGWHVSGTGEPTPERRQSLCGVCWNTRAARSCDLSLTSKEHHNLFTGRGHGEPRAGGPRAGRGTCRNRDESLSNTKEHDNAGRWKFNLHNVMCSWSSASDLLLREQDSYTWS